MAVKDTRQPEPVFTASGAGGVCGSREYFNRPGLMQYSWAEVKVNKGREKTQLNIRVVAISKCMFRKI
jgi:hypothetical protein